MAPSIRLFLLVALLAAVVLAAPTVQVRGLKKRSFQVPRSLNRAHPRGLNGYDAVKKVAFKYNMKNLKEGFISFTKSELISGAGGVNKAANATNGTGTVAANPEQNAALFLSPVDVGGQTLNLDFDSGSSDL
jgi:hypothetical protein